jgi:polysaccharide deacetylase family protein (PEP-CTERM system associated)
MVSNAFTVDVEEHFQVAALKDAIEVDSWSKQESRVVRNTTRLLEILDQHGVKGTFFVLGWVAQRDPGLIRRIVAGGHELACHGFSHQLIYEQDKKVFRDETQRAKRILEDAGGVAVNGYRAASYSITRKSMWALDIIAEAGFRYDSSIVPVRHDLYGIQGAGVFPYTMRLRDQRALTEFPPSTISLAGQRLPIGGGGYFRLFPYWFSRWGMRSVNAQDQPFSFYVHPWEIDPQQPRVETNWKSRFRHYNNLDKCEPRLHRLLKDFNFTTMQNVIDQLDPPTLELAEYNRDSALNAA